MQASGGLVQAIEALRRAVEAEFTGNAYYLLSQEIAEIGELIGRDGGGSPIAFSGASRFSSALGEIRKRAEQELFDNRFFLVVNKLDAMAFLAAQAAEGSPSADARKAKPMAAVQSAAINHSRTFDDLAAASKARVEQVAAKLGIASTTAFGVQHGSSDDGEFERRSSEPCFLGELNEEMAEMASAGVSAQGVAKADGARPALHMGSSAPETGRATGGGVGDRGAAKKETIPQARSAASPAHDRASAAAGETLTDKQPRKSFFARVLSFLLRR